MLDRDIQAVLAQYRPALIRGFAQFVFSQGPKAVVPLEHNGKKLPAAIAGLSWQRVGRLLYGDDFTTAFKAVVEQSKETT